MTQTARKHAWLNRVSPAVRHMFGLYAVEVALILSWTVLADVLLSLLSGEIVPQLPISYLIAVTLLAWLEHTGSRVRLNDPLQAFSLAEVNARGGRPTQWQTLRRLLFTPLLILIPGAAFLPVPRSDSRLLQWISGTRIVSLDSALDPRKDSEIRTGRRRARLKVFSYMGSSLLAAVIVFLIPPGDASMESAGGPVSVHSLPESEAVLLANYLEMSAVYPDSIEFHVRLASLYYRNGMTEDLEYELERVHSIDPEHPILLLGEDLDVGFEDILVVPDSLAADTVETPAGVQVPQEPASDEDSSDTGPPANMDADPVAADSTALEETETEQGSPADPVLSENQEPEPASDSTTGQSTDPLMLTTDSTSASPGPATDTLETVELPASDIPEATSPEDSLTADEPAVSTEVIPGEAVPSEEVEEGQS